MNPRRPARGPGGPREGGGGSGSDDGPAQTNLGLLLQRALQQQAQASTQPAAEAQEVDEAIGDTEIKPCANCWNALTFKDTRGGTMARCGLDLWVRPAFTLDDLNANRIRRWYVDCPAYDDSE
ncbi:MAG: hypothetical protein ACR2NO_12650 [Chloroflexota bacterium]